MRAVKDVLRHVRRRVRAWLGREVWYPVQTQCPTHRLGSEYGEWTICPTHLNADSLVYSFGVGEDISFDLALIHAYGVTVHAFDPTPRSVDWVRAQRLPEPFVFHPYGVADQDGVLSFYPPENPDFVSHTLSAWSAPEDQVITVPVHRLATLMRQLGHDQIDLLKMDIEGAEYGVIADLITCSIKPKQLLVEFHHRLPEIGLDSTKQAIQQLNEYGYKIFSIAPNGEEYAFILD
jgi:FkbM family methyltransferase